MCQTHSYLEPRTTMEIVKTAFSVFSVMGSSIRQKRKGEEWKDNNVYYNV